MPVSEGLGHFSIYYIDWQSRYIIKEKFREESETKIISSHNVTESEIGILGE